MKHLLSSFYMIVFDFFFLSLQRTSMFTSIYKKNKVFVTDKRSSCFCYRQEELLLSPAVETRYEWVKKQGSLWFVVLTTGIEGFHFSPRSTRG
jgi:hypothetical protein